MADKIISVEDGLSKDLPSIKTAKAGRFLITTDTGEMYYEPEDEKRVQINPQADWQQNDETANDYIKNRIGGYEETIELLSNSTIEFLDPAVDLPDFPPIEVGATYKVIFDNVEYKLIGKREPILGEYTYIGNGSYHYSEPDTGEPFIIYTENDTQLCLSTSETLPCTHTIKIEKDSLVKIKEKYLDLKNTNIVNGSTTGSLRTINSAEENSSYTIGDNAFAEGYNTQAKGSCSHAEGGSTKALGLYSHSEGYGTTASSYASHAEGFNTKVSGNFSHSEGSGTTASEESSHAEGSGTIAKGYVSHAEGRNTTASGIYSHSEGSVTQALGNVSHAEGIGTIAKGISSHVQGKYNIEDTNNKYADIVGNGTSDKRSNASTVDWNGNVWYSGDVYVGSTSGINKDEGSRKLATEIYANTVSANAIKGSVSGLNVIQVNDKNNILSPVTHEMGVRVKSKNLLNYELFEPSYTKNGVTFTNHGDGTVTANGTATANTFYYFSGSIELLGYYTLSGCPSGGSTTTYLMGLGASNFADIGSGTTRNFPDKQKANIFIKIFSGVTVENLVFKPQLEEGSTVTTYTPYIPDLTAVKVSRCGKNLFDISKYIGNEKLFYDTSTHTATFKEDTNRIEIKVPFTFMPNIDYALSADSITDNVYIGGLIENDGTNNLWITKARPKVKLRFTKIINTYIQIVKIATSEITTESFKNLQLEIGSATAYEPYMSSTDYTPTADGTVEGVTSLYPNTTLTTDTDGVLIDCEYNRDIGKILDDKVDDVQINGASIVEDGIAVIPWGSQKQAGVFMIKENGTSGIVRSITNPSLEIDPAKSADIDNRRYLRPITSTNLDYAVKVAMCDGKGTTWTETEQKAAMDRIGITDIIGDINTALDSIIEIQNSLIGGN